MAVTLRDLLERSELDLTLLAGDGGIDAPVRCVHTSELDDPTPWLSGDELLLTTGMSLGEPAGQAVYLERLRAAGVAGLGFGIGFGFDATPAALVAAARAEDFPLIEVPYPVPFIAISEAVSSQLAEARVREARYSVEVHEELASLLVGGAGPADILDRLVELGGGWALLFGVRGAVFARSSGAVPDPAAVWSKIPGNLTSPNGPEVSTESGPDGVRIAVPVRSGKRREGVLVFGKPGAVDEHDRIVVRHGASVLGLSLAARRVALTVERRIAGDVLEDAFIGAATGRALVSRLERAGFTTDPIAVLVIDGLGSAPDPEEAELALESRLLERCDVARVTHVGENYAALVPAEPARGLAEAMVGELEGAAVDGTRLRIGVGVSAPRAEVRSSYLSALFTLRSAPEGTPVATQEDLGPYRFLLGGQPEAVLKGLVSGVLGPLIEQDTGRSSELLRSVEVYVRCGGRWEPGAEELGVHRHTLRYRIQQAEEILGRDLSSADAQLEVLLALKAREVLAA